MDEPKTTSEEGGSQGTRIPTGTDISKGPDSLPDRFTANAPDLRAMEPKTPEDFYRRGWIYYNLREYERAEQDLRRAVQNDPTNPEFLYPLGMVLKAQAKKDEAVAIFQQVIGNISRIENFNRAAMLERLSTEQIKRMERGIFKPEI